MNDKHTIFKNIGKNLISLATSQLVSRFLGTIVLLVLPRYLGPADYGVYMTAMSFFGILCVFAGYGLDGLFIKDVSRDQTISQRYFSTNVVIKELLSFLLLIILGLTIYALSYPAKTIMAILTLATAVFFYSIMNSYSAVFRAYEKMEYNAVLEISVNLIRLLGILIVIQLGGSILWIISTIVISQVVFSIIGYILINKIFFKVTWATNRHFIIDSFKKATPFFLVSAVAVIQGQIALIMLSKLGNNVEVGLFSGANELTNILYIIPNLTATVLFPVYSRQYHESSKSLVSASNLSLKYIVILGLPISAGIYFVAPQVIKLIYGSSFSGSVLILQILGLGICMSFITNTITYVLTAADRIAYVTAGNIITVVLNISLNFWLISVWGGVGAALSVLICAIVSFVYFYIIINSSFEGLVILKSFIKPLLATLIMCAVIWWIAANLFLTIALGMIIYGTTIYILKTLHKEELVMIRRMIPFISQKSANN